MPLYAFHCKDCDKNFETLVRASDVDLPTCSGCGSANLEQQVSKICIDIKYPAIAKSWRARAAREGDLNNFSTSEKKEFKKG
jgi:putative FmdB family regulatory protein